MMGNHKGREEKAFLVILATEMGWKRRLNCKSHLAVNKRQMPAPCP